MSFGAAVILGSCGWDDIPKRSMPEAFLADLEISAQSDGQAFRESILVRMSPYALISGVYIFATWMTSSFSPGDTSDYVASIMEHMRGGSPDFWDFGHLFWRPLGWLIFRVSAPLAGRFAGSDQRVQITLILTAVSWLAGLAAAHLLLALLRIYDAHGWVPPLVATAFVFSNAVLNYSRTGCSYLLGLGLLILSLYLIAREAAHPSGHLGTQVCAGVALAGSVSLWFLYVLAVPAAVLLPFVSGPPNKTRFRLSIGTLFVFCLSIGMAYAGVLIHLRLSSVAGIMTWVLASSHGLAIPGLARSIFGWSRSFIYMGDAGRTAKRYMLHDPFHPVTARDLFGLWPELLKLALFYATLFSIAIGLGHSPRGRKARAMAAVAALPILGFAVYWSGGDLERYLPFYPVFFLLLSFSLVDRNAPNCTKAMGCVFILCVVLTNAVSLRSATERGSRTQAENRINGLMPRWKPGSLAIVSHNLDDLMEFSRDVPVSPVHRPAEIRIYPLLIAGRSDVQWRNHFASRALSTWQAGGEIWVSRRLLHTVPEVDWNWVEGDDQQVSWPDFAYFFSRLQFGESVGGEDGFLLLMPSAENWDSLGARAPNESALLPASVE
jgi:hypothetical protein